MPKSFLVKSEGSNDRSKNIYSLSSIVAFFMMGVQLLYDARGLVGIEPKKKLGS